MGRHIRGEVLADDPMAPVDRDMVLVVEGRDGDIDELEPSAVSRALANFTVQRASRSFWRSLAGLSR